MAPNAAKVPVNVAKRHGSICARRFKF